MLIRNNLIIRGLQTLQMLSLLATAAAASFALAQAFHAREDSPAQCECELKARPLAHCEARESTVQAPLWSALFVVQVFWVGLVSLVALLRDLRLGSNRAGNLALFLILGTCSLALGDHFNRLELLAVGGLLCVDAVFLALSIPCCSMEVPKENRSPNEEPFLTHHDEEDDHNNNDNNNGVFSQFQ